MRMRIHPTDMLMNEQVFHRKIHCLTGEFHSKFHAKNRHRSNHEEMSTISVSQVSLKRKQAHQKAKSLFQKDSVDQNSGFGIAE